MTFNQIILVIYCAVLAFMSFITFLLFFKDKSLAKKNQGPKRIKEKTLLASIALGGSIGGLCGSILAHHKTDKSYFRFTIFLSLLCQVAALGYLIYALF